jgi:hypothetical protein
MKINHWNWIAVIIGIAFGAVFIAAAQTTNSITENIFLTDDGHVFWYKAGVRLVDTEKIRTAQKLPESHPAAADPGGHWGAATNGFQLSMRFDKRLFTNGEPIVATLLLRNITNVPVKFMRLSMLHQPSPINIWAFRDKQQLQGKGDNSKLEVVSGTQITIYPQTQRKYTVKLNDYYDLTGVGEFVFQASYGEQCEITSQSVPIQIQ